MVYDLWFMIYGLIPRLVSTNGYDHWLPQMIMMVVTGHGEWLQEVAAAGMSPEVLTVRGGRVEDHSERAATLIVDREQPKPPTEPVRADPTENDHPNPMLVLPSPPPSPPLTLTHSLSRPVAGLLYGICVDFDLFGCRVVASK